MLPSCNTCINFSYWLPLGAFLAMLSCIGGITRKEYILAAIWKKPGLMHVCSVPEQPWQFAQAYQGRNSALL